ncbi:MAG: hypothetical protein ACT4PW_12340 [Acidimicrobiia bacterium]
MRRSANPLVLASAGFVLASGLIHLREWLDTYRFVPTEAPGSFVVRLGFPLHTATAVVITAALVATLFKRFSRFTPLVLLAAIGFQATSLAVLILTRTGTVLGWTEPVWTSAANETRIVEIGALVLLALVVVARTGSEPVAPAPKPTSPTGPPVLRLSAS